MTNQAQRHARKAHSDAKRERRDRRRWKLTGIPAIKRKARRAERRLGKAICADYVGE